jgi:hypothetical protein
VSATLSNNVQPIHFNQHLSASVGPIRQRRVTLADLTPNISTPEEDVLWHNLYSMHTHGSKTNWTAFCAEWNKVATLHKQSGSQAIKHKHVQQLRKYHDKMVKEARSQTHAFTGLHLQAGQPQQQQSQQPLFQQQQAAEGRAAAGVEQQPYQEQQQQQYQHAGLESTAAAAAAAGAAAAAAGSGLFTGGLDPSQLYNQQQLFMGVAGMPYMPAGGAAGLYGMPAPAMTAAPHVGFGGGLAGHGFPVGGFHPAAAVYGPAAGVYDPATAAAKRAAWAESRSQRGQPVKTPRQHRKHRCNKCWRELAGESKQHKNGKDDWAKGLRCPGNCAKCGNPMTQHADPCPAPEQQ